MGLYKDSQIEELYMLKNRHNNNKYSSYNIEENLLKRSVSSYLYSNDTMKNYLDRLEKMYFLLFENYNIIRNFKNWTVHKYYNDHVD